ncbi:hypothetical protein SCYZ1_9 [Pseudomonas phage SCYZ1]|nr:hypothetical protein SCYZ1_9 [Pseudomonas phage SCYZ1]
MSLGYAVVYKDRHGNVAYSQGSHPTCFGALTGASMDVPVGCEIQNVVLLTTFMEEKDFNQAYKELVKVMPTVTINGRVVSAPKATYYKPHSTRFGSVKLFGNRSYLRIKLPKGTLVGEVYVLIKLYFKHLSRPDGGPHHTAIPVAKYWATGRRVFASLDRPFNPLYVMAAMGLSAGLLNYTYPLGRGRLKTEAVRRFFAGDVRVTYEPVRQNLFGRPDILDYSLVYAIKKPSVNHHINVSYIPGMEAVSSTATVEEGSELLRKGELVILRDHQQVTLPGTEDDIEYLIRHIIQQVG